MQLENSLFGVSLETSNEVTPAERDMNGALTELPVNRIQTFPQLLSLSITSRPLVL